jgi:3-deoxy-manno-octulosonate cytidylyltransferase (CMP-KDO synthetase)
MGKVVAVIPARFESARFPGKPLHLIAGKPLVQHVWERCQEADAFDEIIIATDDMRIVETGFNFGARVALTGSEHPSGTDRVAEVARKLIKASLIFNVQGDEPLVAPELLRTLVRKLSRSSSADMITAAVPISPEQATNPNAVKVVLSASGLALYFSRSPIPYFRSAGPIAVLKHLGIYGYRRKTLLRLVRLPPSSLEQVEQLEQLRALENGVNIRVIVSDIDSIGVDTPEDVQLVERKLLSKYRTPS